MTRPISELRDLALAQRELFVSALDRAFDILVAPGGAAEKWRGNFIQRHIDGCERWGYYGALGFVGAYYIRTNTVSCGDPEDETPERAEMITRMNHLLATEAIG